MSHLLRRVRLQSGLTLDDLARLTGLTKSYLSKIERRQSNPSIAVAIKVASALNVDVAQLFSERRDEEKIVVDRAIDRCRDTERYRAMATGLLGKSMSPFVVRPADPTAPVDHPSHDGQEFLFVHSGTIKLDYGDQTLTLAAGDSAYFEASISHAIYAVGDQRPEVLVITVNGVPDRWAGARDSKEPVKYLNE